MDSMTSKMEDRMWEAIWQAAEKILAVHKEKKTGRNFLSIQAIFS